MRNAIALALGCLVFAPAAPATAADSATGADKVIVGVVVKDKKGVVVPDLKPEEFEVTENGSRRPVDSLRFVNATPAPAAGAEGASEAGQLVSLVFDDLDPNQQKVAQQAVRDFLGNALGPDTWIGVFRIGLQLWTVQPFTRDLDLVRQAVDKAASSQDATLAEPDAQARKGVADALAQLSQGKATDPGALARAEVLGRIIRAGDRMQRQRQYASGPSEKVVTSSTQDALNKLASSGPTRVTSISGSPIYLLLALAKGQATAPGRKAVLYFGTGFEVPNLLDDVFKAAMSEANRARVAFYPVDVRGLDTTRQGESARAALEEVATASREQAQKISQGQNVTTSDVTIADRIDASTRADPLQPFKDLAGSTGGFAILNTNDFKKAMTRVASDVTGYYELAYVPQVQEYDGTFRKVEVKVTRGGTKVQSGNGYLATPPDDAGPILAYELPLLEALKAAEPRRDFEIAAGTFHFGSGAEGRDVTLIAEVPASRFKFTADEKNKLYRMHFALLALVKDQEGKVVERVSQDYPFQGPLDKMAAVQQGNVVFKRRLVLPPGRYAVDVVAQDRDAGSTSVHRMPLDVPAAGEGIALSSVVIVRRVEPATATKAGAPVDAFQVETARIVPSLDDAISKAQTPKISVYLIAYPATAAGNPTMTIEFTAQGKAEGRALAPLPAPEPDGRIRYLGTFPIDKFEPGRHELKVTVRQGSAEAQEKLAFTLQP